MVTFNSPNLARSPQLRPLDQSSISASNVSQNWQRGPGSPVYPGDLRMMRPARQPRNQSMESQRKASVSSGTRKVLADLEQSGLLKVTVFDSDRKVFDPQRYLQATGMQARLLSKRYKDEIAQLDGVELELRMMIKDCEDKRTELRKRRETLAQKKFESIDVEFIKEGRFTEIQRIQNLLCQKVLEGERGAERGYLASQRNFCAEFSPSDELILMKCAYHMADRSDLDTLGLLRKCQDLLSALGIQ